MHNGFRWKHIPNTQVHISSNNMDDLIAEKFRIHDLIYECDKEVGNPWAVRVVVVKDPESEKSEATHNEQTPTNISTIISSHFIN